MAAKKIRRHKDPTILQVLSELESTVGPERFRVLDYWDSDRFSIGFANKDTPHRLVYASSYGKDDGKFDFECELGQAEDVSDYEVVESGEDVDLAELIAVIRHHLKLLPEH